MTAELIPHLDLFISLVGAVGSTFLALIYAAVADIVVREKGEFGFFGYKIAISVISIIIGVCGFFVGTTMSLNAIIAALNADTKE